MNSLENLVRVGQLKLESPGLIGAFGIARYRREKFEQVFRRNTECRKRKTV